MIFDRNRLFGFTLTLFLGLVAAGCSDGSSNRGAPNNTGVSSANNPPNTGGAQGSGGTPGTPPGTVGKLTGDPDDEVDPALQQQVADGLAKSDEDDPVDF